MPESYAAHHSLELQAADRVHAQDLHRVGIALDHVISPSDVVLVGIVGDGGNA